MKKIVLASKSPARAALLQGAGIAVDCHPSAIDERAVEAALYRANRAGTVLTPRDLALGLALAKASDVAKRLAAEGVEETLVIGADQVLDHMGRVMHKAQTLEEAQHRLCRLAGTSHQLHSGYAIVSTDDPENALVNACETASLFMRPLSADDIEAYLDSAGPQVLGSVGAYQLEGLGARLFERIEGDYFTVLGLPLLPLAASLRALGVLTF